jgi:hypothetical protein
MSSNTPSVTWKVNASVVSKRTVNPIRQIVDNLKVAPNASKEMISLALGTPRVQAAVVAPRSS